MERFARTEELYAYGNLVRCLDRLDGHIEVLERFALIGYNGPTGLGRSSAYGAPPTAASSAPNTSTVVEFGAVSGLLRCDDRKAITRPRHDYAH